MPRTKLLRQHNVDVSNMLRQRTTEAMPSSKSLSLFVAVLERFYSSYVTLRCDLEL